MICRSVPRLAARYFSSCTSEEVICAAQGRVPNRRMNYEALTRVRVTLLGADTETATTAALPLKLDPLISELRLHGSSEELSLFARDLATLPSPAKVSSFTGPNQLKHALKKADIVVVQGGETEVDENSKESLFKVNAPLVIQLAGATVTSCPDAIFVVMIEPVNATLPLFVETMKQNGVFCPNRVVGSVSEAVYRARRVVASKLGLPASVVHVPVTGGASPDTILPLVSKAEPGGFFLMKESEEIIANLRKEMEAAKKEGKMAAGIALAEFVNVIARGLTGRPSGWYPVLLRTRAVELLNYLVLPVEWGLAGVQSWPQMPAMSRSEGLLLEDAVTLLEEEQAEATLHATKTAPSLAHRQPPMPAFDKCHASSKPC